MGQMMLNTVDFAAERITAESRLKLTFNRKPLALVAHTIQNEFKIWALGDRILQTTHDIRFRIAVDRDVVNVGELDTRLSKTIASCF